MILITFMEIIVGFGEEESMLRILSIDPSGTGTTGVCLVDKQITFQEFKSKDWKEHLTFIKDLLLKENPSLLLYETTNYINSKGKDMTSLLKLMGAMESLPVQTESLLVSQVKDLKSKVFKKTKPIPHLLFKPGQGWFYRQNKISLHQLDAFLVYWLWKEQHG